MWRSLIAPLVQRIVAVYFIDGVACLVCFPLSSPRSINEFPTTKGGTVVFDKTHYSCLHIYALIVPHSAISTTNLIRGVITRT